MALYVVERDLSHVSPEQFLVSQKDVLSACMQLKVQGKKIRYISSAVVAGEGRGLDLFGAESAALVQEVHEAAKVPLARIMEILDLSPSGLPRGMSRARSSLRRSIGSARSEDSRKGSRDTMTENSAPELARWLAEGQRLFSLCLETLESFERLKTRVHTLERENEMLREETARLRHKVDVLQTERSEMVAAFNDLAGHVTQVVDHILQKSEDGETGK